MRLATKGLASALLLAALTRFVAAADASKVTLPLNVPHGSSLARCLELAEKNHPNIWAARARLHFMRSQLDEAHFAPFSQFTATGGLGIAPTVRGNNIYSPETEVSLSSTLAIAGRIGMEWI